MSAHGAELSTPPPRALNSTPPTFVSPFDPVLQLSDRHPGRQLTPSRCRPLRRRRRRSSSRLRRTRQPRRRTRERVPNFSVVAGERSRRAASRENTPRSTHLGAVREVSKAVDVLRLDAARRTRVRDALGEAVAELLERLERHAIDPAHGSAARRRAGERADSERRLEVGRVVGQMAVWRSDDGHDLPHHSSPSPLSASAAIALLSSLRPPLLSPPPWLATASVAW